MGAPKLWTRDQVASRILQGENLLIYDNQLLRIPNSWLDAHPGGSLAILHFVGRDATDEIQAMHLDGTLGSIQRYSIGTVEISENGWEPLLPPVMSGWVRRKGQDGKMEWYSEADTFASTEDTDLSPSSQILLVAKGSTLLPPQSSPTLATVLPPPTRLSLSVQTQHSKAYRALHKRVIDAGLYKTRYLEGYGPEVVRYTLLGGLSAYAYSKNWLLVSAVLLGFMWQQLVFTVHDLGHMGVTANWAADRVISIIIADFIGGLSVGWWVDNHNIHHLIPNHPTHDPDIQHLPFFAISPIFFKSLWSSYYKRIISFDRFSQVFITIQHKLFYVIMAFARFNLYANSYGFLYKKAWDTKRARGGRWAWGLEIVGLIFFWCWFSSVLYGCGSWKKALMYLLVSHAATSPVHIQIVLSHFTMSTADLGTTESFPDRQMRTTTDVICDESIAFIHGGLHLQVAHHLFPRLPRHNLKAASVMIKEFAKENDLVYAEFGGFVKGNGEVLGVLRAVADQVKIIGLVADTEAKEAVEKKVAAKEKKLM